MPISVLMPALSPTMKEGNLVKWHKKKGDTVNAGDMLADIETDKATMEVEAVDEGVLGALLVVEGASGVLVNAPLAVLLEEGETEEDLKAFLKVLDGSTEGQSESPSGSISVKGGAEAQEVSGDEVEVVPEPQNANKEALKSSPLARRLALEHQIDLTTLKGSGPYGRVVKRDVEAALKGGLKKSLSDADVAGAVLDVQDAGSLALKADSKILAVETSLNAGHTKSAAGSHEGVAIQASKPSVSLPSDEVLFSGYEPDFSLEPMTQMRKVIAERLTESKQHVPHFYLKTVAVMDEVLSLRKKIQDTFDQKLSINDCVLKATAMALKAVSGCNSAFSEQGVRQYHRVDLAVAVSIDKGLITPVIRDAAEKSVRQLSAEMKDLAARAREGKLKPEEFQGGTFTVSSLGMFGITEFSAIINPPQSGILAVGAAEKVPVYNKDEQLVMQHQMNLTLSVDHRVVDGVLAATFLNKIKIFLEEPALMLI